MLVNEKKNYMAIGTGVNADYSLINELRLPAPSEIPSSSEFMVSGGRNALGTMVIQQVGRTQYKTSLTWAIMKNTDWWAVNRWFDKHGYVFYARFFDHTTGRIKIQRFYRGNMKEPTPSPLQETRDGYSVPVSYAGAGFSVIDMGERDVRVIKEV